MMWWWWWDLVNSVNLVKTSEFGTRRTTWCHLRRTEPSSSRPMCWSLQTRPRAAVWRTTWWGGPAAMSPVTSVSGGSTWRRDTESWQVRSFGSISLCTSNINPVNRWDCQGNYILTLSSTGGIVITDLYLLKVITKKNYRDKISDVSEKGQDIMS